MAPILVTGFKRVLDQQAPEARAIDEQIARNGCAAFQRDAFHIAAFAIAGDVGDLALDPGDALTGRETAQKGRIEASIEVVGIGDLVHQRLCARGRAGKAAHARGRSAHRIVADIACAHAASALAQEQLVEGDAVEVLAVSAEGVEVTIADLTPIDELDPKLAGAASLTQKFRFGNVEHRVEAANRRDGGFAYADRADRVGFDQGDGALPIIEEPHKRCSRHPSGGAATDDYDPCKAVRVTDTIHPRHPVPILQCREIVGKLPQFPCKSSKTYCQAPRTAISHRPTRGQAI